MTTAARSGCPAPAAPAADPSMIGLPSFIVGSVAGVLAVFAGFWVSYALLVLGLTHNWFGIGADAAVDTQSLFLISWLVVVGMLTLATLRLPVTYTILFALIEVALVLVLVGTVQGVPRVCWPWRVSWCSSSPPSACTCSSARPPRRPGVRRCR